MEAKHFLQEYNRFCYAHAGENGEGCIKCPFNQEVNGISRADCEKLNCWDNSDVFLDHLISIVENWSNENPKEI